MGRIDEIRASVQTAQSFLFGGGRSFDQMLTQATEGGPEFDDLSGLDSLPSGQSGLVDGQVFSLPPTAAPSAAASATPATASPTTESTTVAERIEKLTVGPVLNGAEGSEDAWFTLLPSRGQEWAPAIKEAAERNGLDPKLLAAVVWSESAFNPEAVSSAGAIGLGQLMPGTAAELGVDPTDPEQNLDGSARYLAAQINRFGRNDLGLAAYNAGPGRVSRAGGIPQIAETQAYVHVVLDRYAQLGGGS